MNLSDAAFKDIRQLILSILADIRPNKNVPDNPVMLYYLSQILEKTNLPSVDKPFSHVNLYFYRYGIYSHLKLFHFFRIAL
jgi:hypothetical protein